MKVTNSKVDHYVTLRFRDGEVYTLKDMKSAVSTLIRIARDSTNEDDHIHFGEAALRLLENIDKAIEERRA